MTQMSQISFWEAISSVHNICEHTPLFYEFDILSQNLIILHRIIVIGRPGSDVSNSIGIANRAPQSKKHIGVIVGGIIEGLIGLALLLGTAFYYGQRYGRKNAPTIDDLQSPAPVSEKFNIDIRRDVQYARRSPISCGVPTQSLLPTPPSSSSTDASFQPLLSRTPGFGSQIGRAHV